MHLNTNSTERKVNKNYNNICTCFNHTDFIILPCTSELILITKLGTKEFYKLGAVNNAKTHNHASKRYECKKFPHHTYMKVCIWVDRIIIKTFISTLLAERTTTEDSLSTWNGHNK